MLIRSAGYNEISSIGARLVLVFEQKTRPKKTVETVSCEVSIIFALTKQHPFIKHIRQEIQRDLLWIRQRQSV